MNVCRIINGLKITSEEMSCILVNVKNNKNLCMKRSELSEINTFFKNLDNSVSELSFHIEKLNQKQILKERGLYYKNTDDGECNQQSNFSRSDIR